MTNENSVEWSVKEYQPQGKVKIEKEFSFTASPVPADEILTVSIKSTKFNQAYIVTIYSTDGKEVIRKANVLASVEINTKSLATGIYLLEVADNLREKKEGKSISITHK